MDYFQRLQECFPDQPKENINNIIDCVTESQLENSFTENLNIMIQMMVDSSILSSEMEENSFHNRSGEHSREGIYDEAVGGCEATSGEKKEHMLQELFSLYEDLCPDYAKSVIENNLKLIDIVKLFEKEGYKKLSKIDCKDVQLAKLISVLPMVDPSYLKEQAMYLDDTEEDFNKFVNDMLERTDFPTIEEYIIREDKKNKISNYTTKFDIGHFLKEFPNAEEYFTKPGRVHSLMPTAEPKDGLSLETSYALYELYNYFSFLKHRDIDHYIIYYKYNIVETFAQLDLLPKGMKFKRESQPQPECPLNNILLFQELAFAKNRKAIKQYQIRKLNKQKDLIEEARLQNMLQKCECCFNDEVIPEECCHCPDGCIFCRDCLKKGVETLIGDAKVNFPCFNNCGKEFNLNTIQMVLDPTVYYHMEQRRQMHEIRLANIEGFETCPFCEYGTVPNDDDKIFQCENPNCGKQTCRGCGHEAHLPLRCNEIEYDEDVKLRIFVENKMSEALFRTCKSCGTKIIKETGCNKMTCNCGITMCYICQQSKIDYNHFRSGSCQLYMDQTQLHRENVINAGRLAKEEINAQAGSGLLKKDPTIDISNII